MVTENLNQKISILSSDDQQEVLNYVNFLIYKRYRDTDFHKENLLSHFHKYAIMTWKELSFTIIHSGIARGPVGGYMDSLHVKNWLSDNFHLDYKDAGRVIQILFSMGLLRESYNGNVGEP